MLARPAAVRFGGTRERLIERITHPGHEHEDGFGRPGCVEFGGKLGDDRSIALLLIVPAGPTTICRPMI